MIGRDRIRDLADTLGRGCVALLPTDTVYGLAAALDSPPAVEALYRMKDRDRSQPCQVLIYSRDLLDDALEPLDPVTAGVVRGLLPGPTTCLVPDPVGRFAAAAGVQPGSVGLRVPRMDDTWNGLTIPLVATSANEPGEQDPREVGDVPARIRSLVDAVVDIGPLPGTASAVVDLREPGHAVIIRPGPDPDALMRALEDLGLGVTR